MEMTVGEDVKRGDLLIMDFGGKFVIWTGFPEQDPLDEGPWGYAVRDITKDEAVSYDHKTGEIGGRDAEVATMMCDLVVRAWNSEALVGSMRVRNVAWASKLASILEDAGLAEVTRNRVGSPIRIEILVNTSACSPSSVPWLSEPFEKQEP